MYPYDLNYRLTFRLGLGEWLGVWGKLWAWFVETSVPVGGAKLEADPDLRMPLTLAKNVLILFLLIMGACKNNVALYRWVSVHSPFFLFHLRRYYLERWL